MKPIKTWDGACKLRIQRFDRVHSKLIYLDPGVNFFVLMLEKLGCKTRFSCEGHPYGFYVTFVCPCKTALAIKECGFFQVELEGKNYWSIRMGPHIQTDEGRRILLKLAATAWKKAFGPIESYEY